MEKNIKNKNKNHTHQVWFIGGSVNTRHFFLNEAHRTGTEKSENTKYF